MAQIQQMNFLGYLIRTKKKSRKYLMCIADIFCRWMEVFLIQTGSTMTTAHQLLEQAFYFKELSSES